MAPYVLFNVCTWQQKTMIILLHILKINTHDHLEFYGFALGLSVFSVAEPVGARIHTSTYVMYTYILMYTGGTYNYHNIMCAYVSLLLDW